MTLIHGKQTTNEVTPLLVDSLGRVIISTSEPTTLNPVGALVQYVNNNLPAGQSFQTIYTVPAGQRFRMTFLNLYYAGTVAGVTMQAYTTDGVNLVVLATVLAVTNGRFETFIVDVLLEAGWTVVCNVGGATLNDDFSGRLALQRYK